MTLNIQPGDTVRAKDAPSYPEGTEFVVKSVVSWRNGKGHYATGDPRSLGAWVQHLELVEPEPADPRHEALILEIQSLNAALRRRNETIAELRTQLKDAEPVDVFQALNTLQAQIGANNREAGWHERAETLLFQVLQAERVLGQRSVKDAREALIDHIGTKVMLVVTELSEAIEEMRDGRGWDEVYYKDSSPEKPEGFSIEIADAIIRLLDISAILKFAAGDRVQLKLEANKKRGYKHGGRLV